MLLCLAFGLVGCTFIPLVKSSSSTTAGGGSNVLTPTSATSTNAVQQSKPTTKKEELPKPIKAVTLVLAGNNASDGIIAEFFQYEGKGGQWDVKKVSWRGDSWKRNWILYSDKEDGEYTFTENTRFERNTFCSGGYVRYWKGNKVCTTFGKAIDRDQQIWKEKFPKIKLKDWQSRLRGWGYSARATVDKLSQCKVLVKENKLTENTVNLTVTISCDEGSLFKNFNGAITDLTSQKI